MKTHSNLSEKSLAKIPFITNELIDWGIQSISGIESYSYKISRMFHFEEILKLPIYINIVFLNVIKYLNCC